MKEYFVYILANKSKMLYVGVTNDLLRRLIEHKTGTFPNSYTAKYNLKHLVYFESTDDVSIAIQREKQLKKYKRQWKIDLIENDNPDWKDLSADWQMD